MQVLCGRAGFVLHMYLQLHHPNLRFDRWLIVHIFLNPAAVWSPF